MLGTIPNIVKDLVFLGILFYNMDWSDEWCQKN
jgi:hypothetical protein